MNSNDSNKNKFKQCWHWFGIDLAIFFLIVMCLIGLTIMAALLPIKAHSGGCLIIDVPPQAVIGQPDGDTFYVYNFAPGGRVKIRVQGINTPEVKEPGWDEAKQFTKDWLAKGIFRVTTCGKPTLDRIEGRVERNGETLSDALRQAGLGK